MTKTETAKGTRIEVSRSVFCIHHYNYNDYGMLRYNE